MNLFGVAGLSHSNASVCLVSNILHKVVFQKHMILSHSLEVALAKVLIRKCYEARIPLMTEYILVLHLLHIYKADGSF